MKEIQNKNIWLIGASSGIGRALAKELHDRGANLILSARTEEDLLELNQELGGKHLVETLDVSIAKNIEISIKNITKKHKSIDSIIFLAAIYKPNDIEYMDVDFTKNLVEVNFLGALYTSYAAIKIFKKQKFGQLVLTGSVAGYTGLPGGQPYSATKAAIINFAESLYAEMHDQFDIKLINPGFVKTRMTDKNQFKMPMRIEPDKAAIYIADGLVSKNFEIHFPKIFTYFVKFLGILPYWLKLRITNKLR